jgi:hypothetical protein
MAARTRVLSDQIESFTAVTMTDINKYEIGHMEDPERKDEIDQIKTGNNVADNDARGYVDPSLVITEEENKAMRRRIHKRYALPALILSY